MFDYFLLTFFILLLSYYHPSSPSETHVEWNANSTNGVSTRDAWGSSFATAVVNTQILTIFEYYGSQVYIYSAPQIKMKIKIKKSHKNGFSIMFQS